MRQLSEDRFLADLRTRDALQAAFMDRVIRAINHVARSAGVAVTGDAAPPPPVNAITVKANGEMIHATLSHGAEVSRSIRYFIEADNSPSFPRPHVMDLGSSRVHVFHLPALNDSGVQQPWYFRTLCQNPGSMPSEPTVLGGLANPTAVLLKGTTKMTLLPSTGSGTASSTGQQGGSGLGKQRVSTPKTVRIGKKQASNTPVVPPSITVASHLIAAVASAMQQTSVAQVGTSTVINVNQNPGDGVFNIGGLVVTANPGSVDPGSLGKWYVYHDDPNFTGGNVVYVATSSLLDLGKFPGRFFDGSLTTTVGGGATGGGTGGGGGGRGGNLS